MSSSVHEQTKCAAGKLVVISGPSGTGKTSICDALLARLPNAIWSVSATTRPLRAILILPQVWKNAHCGLPI